MQLVRQLQKDYPNLFSWGQVAILGYKDTLSNLLLEIKENLLDGDDFGVFFNAPRLERFAINLYVSDKTSKHRSLEERTRLFVSESFKMNYDEALRLLSELKSEPLISNHLNTIIYEPEDRVTITYLNPSYIIGFYDLIKNKVSDNTMLISLAQGAFRAGVSLANELNITHLPIRLSMHKSGDEWPQISVDEFVKKVEGYDLFVFDEDCSSGITLFTFRNFLKGLSLEARFGTIGSNTQSSFSKPDYHLISF